MTTQWKRFAAGVLLVLAGGTAAHLVQTAGGVEVSDVRIPSEDGGSLSALLYVPPGATPETPSAGILAVHGYINSRETQSGFAIEYARRGYVVLALDQTGHGFSDGRALGAGYGGPAGLAYLRSLSFVDADRIGLEGHSMGGWASLAAATAHPDGYRSVTLVGSATGPGFAAPGGAGFPRNLGVVFSTYDEFSQLMWGVRDARDVTASGKLKTVFGTEEDVVPGRVYGSLEDGTARWLATPATTHPGDHLSRAAIGDAMEWAERTLGPADALAESLAPSEQVWYWKELATLVALVGGVLVLLGAFEILIERPWFSAAHRDGVGAARRRSFGWWVGLSVTSMVPAVTYFPLTGWGSAFSANAIFPQGITNQILVWAVGNGLVVAAALAVRRGWGQAPPPDDDRLARWRRDGQAALAATLSVAVLYVAVQASHWLFRTDLRFWVVALKPMALHHVPTFLAYVVPFTAFFYVTQKGLHETLSLRGGRPALHYATGLVATTGGFALMTAALYAHLFALGHLPGFGGIGPLFSVIAIQFVPVLATTAIVAVFTWRRTNGTLAGAVACGLLVTWYIVAGQATHA